ncbi:MAG: FecR family protein [Planctomycetaceae bacterium]|nr:FecR family protein [Planctomycetaceae bacterium]
MEDLRAMRITELLIHCCDGLAGKEEIAELECLLDGHPEAIEYSVEVLMDLNYFHGLARSPFSAGCGLAEQDFMSELDPQQQLALLGDFAEYEKTALTMDLPDSQEDKKPELIKKIERHKQARTINKYSLVTAFVCAAALLILAAYVRLAPPQPYEIATVTDAIGAQWSSNLPIAAGSRLSSHSPAIRLTRGIVKLTTDDNVEVLLEAPSEFEFVSYSEVLLHYGKLYAKVSEQGYGFSVATPNSKIVDLGTEFGVLSQIDGSTEIYLVKGKANLFAGEKSQTKTSQLLSAGSAKKVDRRDSAVQEIPMDETAFVRQIDSNANLVWKGQNAIRLADLLLGGNGFGTAPERAIEFDPETGQAVKSGTPAYRPGPAGLTPVRQSPFIDSLFVPSPNKSQVVSSAGHTFDGFDAASGLYYCNIACLKDWTFFDPLQSSFKASQQYNDPAVLYLHSNIGLTIDLDAVRALTPGLRITDFKTFVGIIRMGNNAPEYSEADVWVLLDGQLKDSRKGLRADQGVDIAVPIADCDRFLTLAVTDGGKVYAEGFPANHFDTCGFVEPVFGLASK